METNEQTNKRTNKQNEHGVRVSEKKGEEKRRELKYMGSTVEIGYDRYE